MLIPKLQLLKIIKKAMPLTPRSRKSSLSQLWKLVLNHDSASNSSLVSVDWLASQWSMSGLVKRFQNIRQLYNLVGCIRPLNFINQLEMKYYLRKARLFGNKKSKNKKIIPDATAFKDIIVKLDREGDGKIALLLLLMASTGRRAIDICRIKSTQVRPAGKFRYRIVLPFDKQNSDSVSFMVDFRAIPESYRPTKLERIDGVFRAEINSSLFPFEICANKNLSRKLKFKPHSIRSLMAIYLTCLGMEDESIMNIQGWSDIRSLQLYRRISRFEFEDRSLEWLVRRANA